MRGVDVRTEGREGCAPRREESRRDGGGAELCLRNDAGHKSFVISESGSREEGGGLGGTPQMCVKVCECVTLAVNAARQCLLSLYRCIFAVGAGAWKAFRTLAQWGRTPVSNTHTHTHTELLITESLQQVNYILTKPLFISSRICCTIPLI